MTRRTAGELLLETAVLEQQTANLISVLREQHARSPSLELEQKIERLEADHADALERLFELQRAIEPQPPRTDRLVGGLARSATAPTRAGKRRDRLSHDARRREPLPPA